MCVCVCVCIYMCVCICIYKSQIQLFAIPWTVACQAPLSMEFSRQGSWMHETSAQGWGTGKTQRDGMEREVGGGIGMGSTCKSMADSCQCMAKTTAIL